MNDCPKEKLIDLINQFCEIAGTLDAKTQSEENSINDKLIEMALKIEDASIPVFGYKVNMDFVVSNAIFHNTEAVISEIRKININDNNT